MKKQSRSLSARRAAPEADEPREFSDRLYVMAGWVHGADDGRRVVADPFLKAHKPPQKPAAGRAPTRTEGRA